MKLKSLLFSSVNLKALYKNTWKNCPKWRSHLQIRKETDRQTEKWAIYNQDMYQNSP